jgi:hypothetical protein
LQAREGFLAPTEAAVPAETVGREMPLGEGVMPAQRVGEAMPLGEGEIPAHRIGEAMPLGEGVMPAQRVGEAMPLGEGEIPAQRIGTAVPKEAGVPLQEGTAVQGAEPLSPLSGARTAPLEGETAAVPKEAGVPLDGQPATPGQPLMDRTQPDSVARAAAAQNQPTGGSSSGSGGGGGAGGAGQGFQVNVDQYRSAISPIMDAMHQISELGTQLTSFLTSMESNAPWGNDESGKKFSEGDKGYLHYSKQSQDGVKSLAQALQGVADNLKTMADGYDNSEQTNTGGFAGGDGGGSGGGGGLGGQIGPPSGYTAPTYQMPSNLRPTTGKY